MAVPCDSSEERAEDRKRARRIFCSVFKAPVPESRLPYLEGVKGVNQMKFN